MNIKLGDSLLRSIKVTTTVKGNGNNYGDTIDLEASGLALAGRIKARFYCTEDFASSANTATLRVYSGSSTAPTAIIAESLDRTHSSLDAGVWIEIVLDTHDLDRYVRLGIVNSSASATGKGWGDINPINL